MKKTIKINGVDFTDMFTPCGYTVEYQPVDGGLGGLMQDSTYTEDELGLKAVITLPCMPLSEENLAVLLSEIYSEKYVALYYYDPMLGEYREIEARRGKTSQKFKGIGADGKSYWAGTQLTLTER